MEGKSETFQIPNVYKFCSPLQCSEVVYRSLTPVQAIDLWPEGPLETANYWVPDTLLRQFGAWVRELLQFRCINISNCMDVYYIKYSVVKCPYQA